MAWLGLILCLLTFFLFAGCQTKAFTDPILGPDFAATNAFIKTAELPVTLRRVAVLPMSYSELNASSVSGQEMLEPVLHAELSKTERFELYFVKPSQMELWTGKTHWDAYEELPRNFLKTVAEKTGCDGVLFTRLAQFKAYPPMVIGWRMKLVANDADILWAAEELFDAAEERVSNSARRYARARVKNNPVLEDSRSILLSPTRFGQYTLHAMLETLPAR